MSAHRRATSPSSSCALLGERAPCTVSGRPTGRVSVARKSATPSAGVLQCAVSDASDRPALWSRTLMRLTVCSEDHARADAAYGRCVFLGSQTLGRWQDRTAQDGRALAAEAEGSRLSVLRCGANPACSAREDHDAGTYAEGSPLSPHRAATVDRRLPAVAAQQDGAPAPIGGMGTGALPVDSGVARPSQRSSDDPRQHGQAPAAIIFVATSGCTWRQLPPVFGPAWPTVYRCSAQWSRAWVWAKPHRVVLDELGARGELDWSRCAIDSVSVRAAKGGH